MISDWRRLLGQGDLPFYIVNLPVYKHRSDVPVDDSWTEVRETQALAANNLPHSCLAVTVHTGNRDNIHPVDRNPASLLSQAPTISDIGPTPAWKGTRLL